MTVFKQGANPSPILLERLYLLKLNPAMSLLSGNICFNVSPIWSAELKLKLQLAILANGSIEGPNWL